MKKTVEVTPRKGARIIETEGAQHAKHVRLAGRTPTILELLTLQYCF